MFLDPIIILCRPLLFLAMSAFFIPHTIFNLISSRNLRPFTSLSSFKDHWFARFWVFFGPLSSTAVGPAVAPLLGHATGVVLDIGPGQGHFMRLYAQSPNRSKITKLYAVEPNKGHHAALLEHAKKAGFEDKFEILDSTVETLESKAGIQRHSIDTIVTVQVLCSVNNPQNLIKELRTYLKPNGGKWIAFEHVRRRNDGGVASYQRVLNWAWPTFFNGCNLTRDTAAWIEGTGGWDMEKSGGGLGPLPTDSPWSALPTLAGVLVSQ